MPTKRCIEGGKFWITASINLMIVVIQTLPLSVLMINTTKTLDTHALVSQEASPNGWPIKLFWPSIAYITAFYIPVVEHWLEREIAQHN